MKAKPANRSNQVWRFHREAKIINETCPYITNRVLVAPSAARYHYAAGFAIANAPAALARLVSARANPNTCPRPTSNVTSRHVTSWAPDAPRNPLDPNDTARPPTNLRNRSPGKRRITHSDHIFVPPSHFPHCTLCPF